MLLPSSFLFFLYFPSFHSVSLIDWLSLTHTPNRTTGDNNNKTVAAPCCTARASSPPAVVAAAAVEQIILVVPFFRFLSVPRQEDCRQRWRIQAIAFRDSITGQRKGSTTQWSKTWTWKKVRGQRKRELVEQEEDGPSSNSCGYEYDGGGGGSRPAILLLLLCHRRRRRHDQLVSSSRTTERLLVSGPDSCSQPHARTSSSSVHTLAPRSHTLMSPMSVCCRGSSP